MTRPARKPSLNCVLSLYLLALSTALAGNARSQITESSPNGADAPIKIRITRPERPQAIQPTLFGSFLEPIGHSTYGAHLVASQRSGA